VVTDTETPRVNDRGRLDATAKATGKTRYVADLTRPGMAHVAVTRSLRAHALIKSIDTSAALASPGVIGVFTADDVTPSTYGRSLRDTPILARGKVRFIGERVAAVVAESRELAEIAAGLVEVEYDDLPAAVTIDEALAEGAPRIHESPWEYPGAAIAEGEAPNLVFHGTSGDLEAAEAALASAAFVIDETYTTQSVHQGYLETQSCIAEWDAEGRLQLWLTNKSPYSARNQVAACLGIDPKSIDFHPVPLGGDFGGKGSPEDSPLCAELARLTGRPVKSVLRYSDDLTTTNPRHPSRIRVRIGCDREGKFVAMVQDAVFNGGAYGAFTPRANGPTGHGLTTYEIPFAYGEFRRVYTNTVPRGNMRTPGSPQSTFAFESAIDELAAKAGIDPAELRRRNLRQTVDNGGTGGWLEYRGEETLQAALDAYEPREAPEGWLHGQGIALFTHATTTVVSTSMRLTPTPQGGVTCELPLAETGTGSHTVARELVAEGLGISPDQVQVLQVETDDLPRDAGAGGSRVTASLAHAVDAAVKAWQSRLGDESVMVEVDESGGPGVGSYCAQVAQVAIDPETGQVKVLEILTAVDIASIINEKAHQMQIDGGTVMGFGFACLEDLDEADGQVWAANLGEFKVTSAQDVPPLRTVLVRGGIGVGTANVKMIGELTNCSTAPAIANAVAAAAGCRIRSLPINANRVYSALHAGH
jgi:CO/xanthine dehydrogenase Mo-binding subunit